MRQPVLFKWPVLSGSWRHETYQMVRKDRACLKRGNPWNSNVPGVCSRGLLEPTI